jgi:hypothetical protein
LVRTLTGSSTSVGVQILTAECYVESLMRTWHEKKKFHKHFKVVEHADFGDDAEESPLLLAVKDVAADIEFEPRLTEGLPRSIKYKSWVVKLAAELADQVDNPKTLTPSSLADIPDAGATSESNLIDVLKQNVEVHQALAAMGLDVLHAFHQYASPMAKWHSQLDKLVSLREGQTLQQLWPEFAAAFQRVSRILGLVGTIPFDLCAVPHLFPASAQRDERGR